MSFFWQGRLEDKPSDLLKYYYADAMRHDVFLDALHQWDKAQVIVLAEQKFATPDVIKKLIAAIVSLEREGVVETRRELWNVIHGGEEYMRRHCDEEVSGWLHLGRSSPSLRVVASRIAFRDLLLRIMAATLDLREQFIETASQHVDTIMPGYSYIQHIEPTTFGFYLMSFVEPLERDFGRLHNCYRNTNISAVGTGAAYGIEYPLDLARFDALLGFDAAPWNARDSIRNYDYMIETYMALALLHSTLGRLAMDFLIWHTAEFGFIRIPDRLSITSSISPQMRIPYVLEFIHGTSGLMAGRLMEALAITKTASDQLEMATMLPAEFWQCADESVRAMDALIDTIDGMRIDKDVMAKTANAYWAHASALIGYLVKEKNLSYRSGHQVLARVMKTVADRRYKVSELTAEMVEEAAQAHLGRRLGITQDVLERIFDARYCVEQRHYRGGTAAVRVEEHITAARKRLADERRALEGLTQRVKASRDLLKNAFIDVHGQYA